MEKIRQNGKYAGMPEKQAKMMEKSRYRFYDKDFKEVPAEAEDKWKRIAYGIDFEKKEVEITNYPVGVGNGDEILTNIFITFDQIKKLKGLINGIQ